MPLWPRPGSGESTSHRCAQFSSRERFVTRSTYACSDTAAAEPDGVSPGEVVAAPRVETDEIDAIARAFVTKFPSLPEAYVRQVVELTHQRLARTARIRTHLIPLTVNLARSQLEKARSQNHAVTWTAGEPETCSW
ncbi:three-helix bundle dimerization domain-containing protein [Nocardia ignorata]|uniref:three-helix bundle dimerization domain-containing protein n=1 Tax=Nocardia ignorata TaxID=145285 RepID=UPI003631831F